MKTNTLVLSLAVLFVLVGSVEAKHKRYRD